MATAYAMPPLPAASVPPRRTSPALVRSRPSLVRGEELWQRWDALKRQRSSWEYDYQDIVNYLVPGADDILNMRAPGQSRTEYIYDSRPLRAPQTLAANIQGAVTNPALDWFRLRFRLEALNQLQHVNGWLEACDTTMLACYNASNFYQAAHTYYLQLGAFGTAAMYVTARRQEVAGVHLQFKTLPVGSYCIAENADGRVDTLFRECWFSPRQAYQQFGEGVSQHTMAALGEAQTMDKPERYLHAVYPRMDRRPDRMGNRNMPWVDCYLDGDTHEVVKEAGYEEFPFVVSRWETLAQSPYGFGPGHLALPDVRVLNKLREMNLSQLQLWAAPPFFITGHEGIVGNISLDPYALNYESVQNAIRAFESGGRPDLVQINAQDLMGSINDSFYVNALQALPPPGATPTTAFEVAQRIELMQRVMGPVFTRLLSEMLDPLADRVFGLLLRARALPQPPMEVLYAAAQNAGQLDVEYEGPLARAQRQTDAQSIGQTVRMTSEIVQASGHADIWENYDLDAMSRRIAEVNGMPRSLVLDALDVQRMRKARAQVQAQQQQDAEARANAQTAPAVAETMQRFAALGQGARQMGGPMPTGLPPAQAA